MAIYDESGRVHWANRSFTRLTGHGGAELLHGLYWNQITPPEWSEADEAAQQELRTGVSAPVYEKELLSRRGERIPVLVSLSLMEGEPRRYAVTALDLREHRRLESLERQMQQTQRLDAIGRLAGGVAHDFNNLLMIILSNVQLAQESLPADAAAQEQLEEAVRACDRAAELTQQLLAFGRRQLQAIEKADLGDIVRETIEIAGPLLSDEIALTTHLPDEPLRALIDRGQLTQLLIHLLFNARDAMHGCGRIELSLRRVLSLGETASGEPLPSGHHLLLEVADDGPGMDKLTRDSLFEPFFTTKEFGQGRGMGLAAAYGVVKQNGGYIYVDSSPGAGARFRVYFPQAVEEAETRAEAQQSGDTGAARILLVEDEGPLRAAVRRYLSSRGHQVLEACDGEEACCLVSGEEPKIDLLLSDVAMPRMGGVELTQRLRRRFPHLPVLLMSGYADHDEARRIEAPVGLLYKPFSMLALDDRIRQCLRRSTPLLNQI